MAWLLKFHVQSQRKRQPMKSICTMALLMLMGSALGQNQKDISIQYHKDGSRTLIDDDRKEVVTVKLNPDGLVTFKEVSIVNDSRVLRYEYVYDHKNRLVESIDYSRSSGYRKNVITYNESGLRTTETFYESVDPHKKGNWRIATKMNRAYDHQNREIRFESLQIKGRTIPEHFHLIIQSTYNSDGTRTTSEQRLDANGRVIKSSRGKSAGRGPSEPYDDNIVGEMTSTSNGFTVTTASRNLKYVASFENNRLVEEKFFRFGSGTSDVRKITFELWYRAKYIYRNGKLVEQLMYDEADLTSKRVIEYEGNKPVRYKRYYRQNGTMKLMVKQGFTPAHEQFFPPLSQDYRPGDNLSAFGTGASEPTASSNDIIEQQSQLEESHVYNEQPQGNGIIRDLENTPKQSLSGKMAALDAETQALLDQIHMLANSNSLETITDAQILHLALQDLVAKHRNELKLLNQKHLDSQQTLFD